LERTEANSGKRRWQLQVMKWRRRSPYRRLNPLGIKFPTKNPALVRRSGQERGTLYDVVGSVKRHFECVSLGRLIFLFLKPESFLILTKARM
jgi:hypothetical protein